MTDAKPESILAYMDRVARQLAEGDTEPRLLYTSRENLRKIEEHYRKRGVKVPLPDELLWRCWP